MKRHISLHARLYCRCMFSCFLALSFSLSLFCLAGAALGATISRVEYFIDNDPGMGSATIVPIENTGDVSAVFTIDTSALSDGRHMLYLRTQDSDGTWSMPVARPFDKYSPIALTNIEEVEYFIDTDPGYGNGTTVTIEEATDIAKSLTLDSSTLSTGRHHLYFRARDGNGVWSMPAVRPFDIPEPQEITSIEYFIDTDPGYGNGTSIDITPGSDVSLSFSADTTGLSMGDHTLYVRGLNADGSRGVLYAHTFAITEVLGGKVTGTITADALGTTGIVVANATISIDGTEYEATTDSDGNFVFQDIPDGTYTATITSPDTLPQSVQFTVNGGYDVVLTDISPLSVISAENYDAAVEEAAEAAAETERKKWDANDDGRIGLEEAINALKVTTDTTD